MVSAPMLVLALALASAADSENCGAAIAGARGDWSVARKAAHRWYASRGESVAAAKSCKDAWAAATDDASAARAIELAAAAPLRKPFGGARLAASLRRAFDGTGFEAYGPMPMRSAAVLPMLLEPNVTVWIPPLGALELAQDAWLRPYDTATTLWPAGAVLAHSIAAPANCKRFRGQRVVDLGAGVGAASIALARCGAFTVAADVALRALALVAENAVANGVRAQPLQATEADEGSVVPWVLDWTDDEALDALRHAWGPFDAVVGAALQFERWPEGRIFEVLDRLGAAAATLAHAWGDGKADAPRDEAWALNDAFSGAAMGLDEFAAVTFRRRSLAAPSFAPPTAHPADAEL